jgi:Leucine-rich repeat (LRR) protein
VQLCLAEQCITQIQGLDLPNLRSLYLQNNKISKIEGLEECPRLQIWKSDPNDRKYPLLSRLERTMTSGNK